MTTLLESLRTALADRYRLERELGSGGMATVYLAEDLKHDRKVAIKVLRPELAAVIGAERFLSEIKTTANLQHPHILPLFDSGQASDASGAFLYYVMPYIEGESLRDRLTREKQLPVADAVRIATEVAGALDYAHRHGVIHRDIKPENVLLHDGSALVADFGIALALGTGQARLTETGLAVGTPAYMSPEQSAGERDLDARTDVYALGSVLYEMLAGEPPYTGPTAQAVIAKRMMGPVPRLGTTRDVPPPIEAAVSRALARAPADRFPTATEFARALAEGLQGAALDAGAHPRAPSGRRTRRWPWPLAAGGLAVAVVLGWLVSRQGAEPTLDADVVAVAPFDILGPSLELWREGMVDVLARNLDGAGPLRTVAPSTVIRRWSGRADPPSVRALGRRTGARLAVFGQLFATEGDSVRARATIYDVRDDRPLGEVEVKGSGATMDRVADSITVGLLRELGRSRPVGAVRATLLRSTSLPALRAFLKGEQLFRRTAWDSALAAYREAVAADSGLAPAWRRMGEVVGWSNNPNDSLAEVYSLRAATFNHGLAPRESLLVTADSLSTALYAGSRDTSFRAHRSRLHSTLELAAQRYPDDPEVWYELGDAGHHFSRPGRTSLEQQLKAFDRAIALDSAFGESYIHPIWLSLWLGQPERTRRYVRAYRAHAAGPGGDFPRAFEIVDHLANDPPGPERARLFDGANRRQLGEVFLAVSHWADSQETAVEVARAMERAPASGVMPWDDPGLVRGFLSQALGLRGRLRQAYEAAPDGALGAAIRLAPLGGVPPGDAAETFRRWLREPPLSEAPSPVPSGFNTLLFTALPWWAARHDTGSLDAFAGRMTGLKARARADILPWLDYGRASAEAYLALARGDTAAAAHRFSALPDTICACIYDQIIAAQLLLAQGSAREAVGVFEGQLPPLFHPATGLWWLTRGRVHEATGEWEKAIVDYSYTAALWRQADPELQPYVREAREGLARLTGEPQR